MSNPFGHMYSGYAVAIPTKTSAAPSATNAPATVYTSRNVDMMHPFPWMSYLFGPMLYGNTMLHGYPRAFSAKVPNPTPTTSTPTTKNATSFQITATTSTTVDSNS